MIYICVGILGIVLILLNTRVIKSESKDFKGEFRSAVDNMTEEQFALGQMRKEFGETIYEIQQELELIKKDMKEIAKNSNSEELKKNTDKEIELYSPALELLSKTQEEDNFNITTTENNKADTQAKSNNIKVEEVRKLINEGFGLEEISKKLNIGKGEVLLIKELYIK